MRFVFLCQHFPPETGAPQIRTYEISKELIKRGHQVEVLTAFPHHPHGVIPTEYRGKFYMKEDFDGIPVHRAWIYPARKKSFLIRLASYFSFTFSAFYSILKAKPTDVIICTSPPLFLGITGYLGAKMKRAKFIFNVADIWPESAVKLGILKNRRFIQLAEKLEGFLYSKSWKIATATEGIRDYMIEKGKRPSDVFLLPNGVNTETFKPMGKSERLLHETRLNGKKVFTYAGNLGHAQGLDSVLRAAKLVEREFPDAHFLFVGDGPLKGQLHELKDKLELSNVTFYGAVPVQKMPEIFSISDYSIVSLRDLDLFSGARPSKIFPAIATGTPVLYCGTGESAQILESHNSGRVALPENPEAIAEGIRALMQVSATEYRQLAENGRRLATNSFSWATIVDDLLEQVAD